MTTSAQTYDVDIADVEYLKHGDDPFMARLFKPRDSGPFPIMVELHGGAWVNGNRFNSDEANEALAKNGVIVAALDFRVPPVASYPASLADIHYGIRWCKSQAASWNRSGSPSDIPIKLSGRGTTRDSLSPKKRAGTATMNPAMGPAAPMSNNIRLVGIEWRIRITAPIVPVRGRGAGRK